MSADAWLLVRPAWMPLQQWNWIMMNREYTPRVVGSWHSSREHTERCLCERCESLAVNGWAK